MFKLENKIVVLINQVGDRYISKAVERRLPTKRSSSKYDPNRSYVRGCWWLRQYIWTFKHNVGELVE